MNKSRLDSKLYDRHYFEYVCGGHEEFNRNVVTPWAKFAMLIADIQPGMVVLDIGSGRGEIISQCSQQEAVTVGIDYSDIALQISNERKRHIANIGKLYHLVQGNAIRLPLTAETFDVIFMMDIVEHLYPDELDKSLREVRRLLKPGGRLVVHTVPNANYYRYVYPLFRLMKNISGKNLPKNPRERVYHGYVHVNEQTANRLKQVLTKNGFSSIKTWQKQLTGSKAKRFFSSLFLLRVLLSNDIFALAKK